MGQFIEKVRREYGIEIDPASAAIVGGRFLSQDRQVYPLPVFGEDELMLVHLLQQFCRIYRVPPEDFGLLPEEDD